MDMVTKKKQQSWLDFKSGKGAKKKVRALPCTFASATDLSSFCSGDPEAKPSKSEAAMQGRY